MLNKKLLCLVLLLSAVFVASVLAGGHHRSRFSSRRHQSYGTQYTTDPYDPYRAASYYPRGGKAVMSSRHGSSSDSQMSSRRHYNYYYPRGDKVAQNTDVKTVAHTDVSQKSQDSTAVGTKTYAKVTDVQSSETRTRVMNRSHRSQNRRHSQSYYPRGYGYRRPYGRSSRGSSSRSSVRHFHKKFYYPRSYGYRRGSNSGRSFYRRYPKYY